MVSDVDIWRAALLMMVKRYGADAMLEAGRHDRLQAGRADMVI